jgi:hypothetical protein
MWELISYVIPAGLVAKAGYNMVARKQLLQLGAYRNYIIKETKFACQYLDVTSIHTDYAFKSDSRV